LTSSSIIAPNILLKMGRKIATATFLSSILLLGIQYSGALVTPQPVLADRPTTTRLHAQKKTSNNNIAASTILATSVLIGAAASWNPAPVQAYVPSDYASETVQEAVTALKAASGDADATFKVYETINGVITEGKGVGGMVNYSEFRYLLCAKMSRLLEDDLFRFAWGRLCFFDLEGFLFGYSPPCAIQPHALTLLFPLVSRGYPIGTRLCCG
jgi:hypothetical protein